MCKTARVGVSPSTVVGCLLLFFALSAVGGEKDVIINEIMYHPSLDMEELQYVELFNRGDTAVDLSKWSFTKGIKYVFSPGTKLEGGNTLSFAAMKRSLPATTGRRSQWWAILMGNSAFTGRTSS